MRLSDLAGMVTYPSPVRPLRMLHFPHVRFLQFPLSTSRHISDNLRSTPFSLLLSLTSNYVSTGTHSTNIWVVLFHGLLDYEVGEDDDMHRRTRHRNFTREYAKILPVIGASVRIYCSGTVGDIERKKHLL